jgi:hypothetical protein
MAEQSYGIVLAVRGHRQGCAESLCQAREALAVLELSPTGGLGDWFVSRAYQAQPEVVARDARTEAAGLLERFQQDLLAAPCRRPSFLLLALVVG